jgi:hypothetical protein
MASSSLRSVPSTPLDDLRALLVSRTEDDPAFPSRLLQMLQKLRQLALPKLEEQLVNPMASKALIRAILEAIPKIDWPDWVPILGRQMEKEPDLGHFDRGCIALGCIGNKAALTELLRLKALRGDTERQLILNRELEPFTPIQPVEVYLTRLMEGAANPRTAQIAGKALASLATIDHLTDLLEIYRRGESLSRHLALRVMAGLSSPLVIPVLFALFSDTVEECRETQQLVDLLERSQVVPKTQTRDEMLKILADRLAERAPKELGDLRHALGTEGSDPAPWVKALEDFINGPFESHLLEGFGLLLENKVARFGSLVTERLAASRNRLAGYAAAVDTLAETLVQETKTGRVELQHLVPKFSEAMKAGAGGDGLLIAFARLVPADAVDLLGETLKDPDIDRRRRFLEAVGSREEDAFVPFFLKALEDPFVEVATLAMHHLGRLPSSFPVLLEGFNSGQTEKVRTAIRVWGENHTRAALESILGFVQVDSRDELVVEGVDALANLCEPASAAPLLALLHDGKPRNLQLSLARALGALKTPEGSLGLLDKAPSLKVPQVLLLCLKGALAAFPSFRNPFPESRLPDLQALILRCCDEREGEGQREPAILATQELFSFEAGIYGLLKDTFSQFVAELRSKDAWDKDQLDAITNVIRELTRRNASLAQITEKESNIREQLHKVPASGPLRAEALLGLRESLQDPELLLRPPFVAELAATVLAGIKAPGAEWRDQAHLCQIAGKLGTQELIPPIRDLYHRATGLGLRSATREALLALGLTEADLNRRGPIHSILILEPSAFFLKRLTTALEATGRTVRGTTQRSEAEKMLRSEPVDLVITEREEGGTDLVAWLLDQWNQERLRYALVSTSHRDPLSVEAPWIIGTLFKPYPMEQLIHSLEN